jgi:tetratricopeptide (TPR) repeat protein
LLVLVGCSIKKDTFLARNSHALSTEYNILYNGQIGLDKGIAGIKASSSDDFWNRLPIEKMQINDDVSATVKAKNADFELAETKATKAIQKHSMYIDGREKNTQIDEAYLLLGKARYYDQRFVPALDAFNYILYKYPTSSTIYEAKIWREKTNMRLGNDALVINNITRLVRDKSIKKQVFSDANALLSEAFINLEEKDSAVSKLKLAIEYSTKNSQKARYRFILGQLYEEIEKKDSARYSYQSVIHMNRKSERKYVIQAHARLAQLFDYEKADTTAFIKKFTKLLADRENRPFLDMINYQMGVFYDKQNKQDQALSYYNASLKKATTNEYLIASNYRNIGNMYFKNTAYPIAAKYYDSTLVKLNPKTREFIKISKIRKDLDEVILYESIAARNDSVLTIVSMDEPQKVAYFENYITKLKAVDEAKRIAEEQRKATQENIDRNTSSVANNAISFAPQASTVKTPSNSPGNPSTASFYFYTPTAVAFGKVAFKKNWGNRSSEGNWRVSSVKNGIEKNDSALIAIEENQDTTATNIPKIAAYTTDFYIKQLPTATTAIDSISKERNAAYYQLGVIYKEKFKEYELATTKLEKLLQNNPEEKLILPTKYHLFKIYQITNAEKAAAMKNSITATYPNSRYAQIISDTNTDVTALADTPENVYDALYKKFSDQEYNDVLTNIDPLIVQFSAEDIVTKFELLKANTLGKLNGVVAYKQALQYVADSYPNSEEGKNAKEIVEKQIPVLERMELSTNNTTNWKILYKISSTDTLNKKEVEDKITKYITAEKYQTISFSYDSYSPQESFITIHGNNSKGQAMGLVNYLKENKDYLISIPAIVITSENYKVVQIKKNLDAYLASIN